MNDGFLEKVWDGLLSREASKIKDAFDSLDKVNQETVIAHLERMSTETDWHPEQQRSARISLEVIRKMETR